MCVSAQLASDQVSKQVSWSQGQEEANKVFVCVCVFQCTYAI